MFILTRSTKEKIVTAGTVIALFPFAALSMRLASQAYASDLGSDRLILLLFSLWSLLTPILIFRGTPTGYTMARGLLGLIAIGFCTIPFNSFAYEDVELAGGSHVHFFFENVAVGILVLFLWYCLGEHARLRRPVALILDA